MRAPHVETAEAEIVRPQNGLIERALAAAAEIPVEIFGIRSWRRFGLC
jgi:hypothetical protein